MGRHVRAVTIVDRLVDLGSSGRKIVLAGWLIAVAAAAFMSHGLPALLSGGGWSVTGSESAHVAELQSQGFLGRGATTLTLVVQDGSASADSPEFSQRVSAVIDEVAGTPELAVTSRFGWADLSPAGRGGYVGKDGRTAIEYLALGLDDGTARRELPAIQTALTERYEPQGMSVILVGESAFWSQVNALSAQGLARAELLTLPLLLLILLLLYGGVVAALVSLAVAGSSIAFTSGILTLIAPHVELSVFVENTATMLGLGIGVDYSLFIISRFKEELRAGRSVPAAVKVSLRTSGHTVLASGLTVLVALGALFLVPLTVIQSIALGGILVVGFSVFVSVVLLPLLLLALGHRVERGRIPLRYQTTRAPRGRWHGFALTIMRSPVRFLMVGAAALLLIAWPALTLQTNTSDARIVPAGSAVRIGYDQVGTGFGVGAAAPIQVVVIAPTPLQGAESGAALLRLRDRLAGLPGVDRTLSILDVGDAMSPADPAAVLNPSLLASLPPDAAASAAHFLSNDHARTVIEVFGTDYAASPAAVSLLAAVRTTVHGAEWPWQVLVGGETAASTDSNQVIQDHLPLVVAVMLLVVYLLLFVTFGSLILPLKAIAMNLLSLGATYGVLVLVFQRGVGAGLLGEQPGPVQNFVPVLLLALLFSLSTDYEVFLLSRIREEYLKTGDNKLSVATALSRTAPLISGAAVLMIAVFGAFAFTAILPMKQLGLGMAVAIAIDATLIRLVMVPASMRLLGPWNWWPRLPGRSATAVGTGMSRHVHRPRHLAAPSAALPALTRPIPIRPALVRPLQTRPAVPRHRPLVREVPRSGTIEPAPRNPVPAGSAR